SAMAHWKKLHGDESGGVNLNLVITPMLDMSFQIFAFFIMTYHPSAMEAHIDGKLLPAAKAVFAGPAMGEKKDDTPPADQEPDVKQTVRVVVKAVAAGQREGDRAEGQPSKIMLKIPDVAEPEELTNPSMTLKAGLDKLKARLTDLRNSPTGGKLN